MRKAIPVIAFLVMTAIAITSCNYPLAGGTTTGNPTPDMTLTALFAPTNTQASLIVVNPTTGPTLEPTAEITHTQALPTAGAPTATSVPPTAAPLPTRPGPTVNAYYLSKKPELDGEWGDWVDKAKQYGMDYVVYGKENWDGADDLQASYILGWDGNYLYVAFKVRDDIYAQNASGADIYMGDSVELLIDTDLYGDFYYTSLSADDYQLGISPGKGDLSAPTEAYLWYPKNVAGTRSQVAAVSTGTAGLYRIEARIPWSMLGVSPYAGMHLGFVASVNDNDNTSENIQQTMMSGNKLRTGFTNPTVWGEMILK